MDSLVILQLMVEMVNAMMLVLMVSTLLNVSLLNPSAIQMFAMNVLVLTLLNVLMAWAVLLINNAIQVALQEKVLNVPLHLLMFVEL
jgi:hypothetical protein